MSNPIDNGPRVNGTVVRGSIRSQSPEDAKRGEQAGSEQSAKAGPAERGVASERLQAVREQIDNTPEVDMERVEAIKQSIAEGRYPVDADRIAQKFVELEGLLND